MDKTKSKGCFGIREKRQCCSKVRQRESGLKSPLSYSIAQSKGETNAMGIRIAEDYGIHVRNLAKESMAEKQAKFEW